MPLSSEISQKGWWACASIADARSPVCGGGGHGGLRYLGGVARQARSGRGRDTVWLHPLALEARIEAHEEGGQA